MGTTTSCANAHDASRELAPSERREAAERWVAIANPTISMRAYMMRPLGGYTRDYTIASIITDQWGLALFRV